MNKSVYESVVAGIVQKWEELNKPKKGRKKREKTALKKLKKSSI